MYYFETTTQQRELINVFTGEGAGTFSIASGAGKSRPTMKDLYVMRDESGKDDNWENRTTNISVAWDFCLTNPCMLVTDIQKSRDEFPEIDCKYINKYPSTSPDDLPF